MEKGGRIQAIDGQLHPPNEIIQCVQSLLNGKQMASRNQATDGPLHLPKEIIQHIQSFLNGKQAALTAVLSKSWYNAWLTRPCLDFDERYFQKQNSDPQMDGKFVDFVIRCMERYHELGLNIRRFILWMNVWDTDSYSLASGLIVEAVKMGASCINIEFHPPISEYLLPEEVFASKSLVGLSVVGCRVLGGQIMCSRLKYLFLCKVSVGDDMIRDIMLKCPLIVHLFFSHCEGMMKGYLSKLVELKSFSFIGDVNTPVEGTPLIEFQDQNFGSVIGDRIIVSEFRNLSYLLLHGVKINEMLLSNFAKNFPSVKHLKMEYCSGCGRFDISSNSLEYITLTHRAKLEVQLDAPDIRRFTFTGTVIPSLSLVASSSQWESDITYVSWDHHLGNSWFLQLQNFLKNLSQSKIFLAIGLFGLESTDFVPHNQDFARPMVERLFLTMDPSTSVFLAVLEGLFWSFRPKFIDQFLYPMSKKKIVG